MTESKIKPEKEIRQNTGAILNPAACGASPTRNFLSVGFAAKGICEYIEPTGEEIPENTAPIIDLNGAGGSLNVSDTFTEGDVATAYLSAATVTDADSNPLATLSIVGSGILDGASEVLVIGGTSYPLNANKTATGTAGSTTFSIAYTTSTWTFAITNNAGGTMSLTDLQSLVRGISYENTSADPTDGDRGFSFVVNDGEDNSSAATLTIGVVAVNDAPVVDLNGAGGGINASGTFTEGDAFTSYLSSATLTDADSDPLVSLIMTCGGDDWGADGLDEQIKFDTWVTDSDTDLTDTLVVGSTTFQLAFVALTGILTITKSGGGTFPAADGQALKRLFQYANAAEPPTTGDRTFSWVANDGTDNSTAAVLTVTVAAAGGETAPSLANPGARWVARTQTIAPIDTANSGSDGTWSVTSGTLPTGLSLNTSTGDITGTVDAGVTPGVFTPELTCTNGAGSDAVTLNIDVLATFVEIDSSDTFPFYCNTANALYVLTEDITVDGTAFVMIGAGVVLDLQGHTVTYANAVAPTVTGGDFSTGWTFSGDFSLNSPGSFIDAEVWPESATTGCAISIPTTTADESLESANTVALVAGEWYAVKMHVNVPYTSVSSTHSVYVELDDGGGNVHRADYDAADFSGNSRTFRPMTPRVLRFKCLASGDYTVRIGIENADGDSANTVYFSNIEVLRTGRHGVVIGPESFHGEQYWPELHAIGTWGTTTNAVITTSVPGGVIQSGSGAGYECHAVLNWDGTTTTIAGINGDADSLTLTVTGPQSKAVEISSDTQEVITMKDVALDARPTWIQNRASYDGSAMGVFCKGTFTNVKIANSIQIGLSLKGKSTVNGLLASATDSLYTNDFTILSDSVSAYPGDGAVIENCVIDYSTSPKEGRGIFVKTQNPAAETTYVRNNSVHVVNRSSNQEYSGTPIGGAYALQTEKFDDVEITDNSLTTSGPGGGAAFRLNPDDGGGTAIVTGNTFTANAESGGSPSMCLRVAEFEASTVTFSDNTLSSNCRWIVNEFASALPDGFVIDSCHFAKTTTSGVTFHPWQIYQGATIVDWVILDPTFEDSTSEAAMDEAVLDWAGTGVDSGSSYTVEHTATFTVETSGTPVGSAAVTIYDASGASVSSGTANGSGVYSAQLKEYGYAGSTRTAHTPHRINAASSWHTVPIAWGNKTLTLETTEGEPNIVDPGAYEWGDGNTISEALTNNGATGTFSLTSGSWPTGISMDSSGNITGTISGTGSFTPVVRCTGTYGYHEITLDITVATAGTTWDIDATDDGFIKGDTNANSNFGTATTMEIKSITGALNNTRVIVLGFDLTSVTSCSAATLTMEQTQLSTSEDSYDVYGVDAAYEAAWTDSNLTWNTCPGKDTAAIGVDPAETTFLGTVVIAANAANGTVFSLSSTELATYLNGRAGDSQVTIIIIETNENTPLKTWAAHEHATAAAPHLEIDE